MIKLRSLAKSDIITLNDLWEKYWNDYSLPSLKNRVIDALAVDEKDRIIGYGQVKLFAEAQLFLDPTARKRDRVAALKLLMDEAQRGVHKAGLEDLYVFIKNPDFAVLIAQRYGFERVIEPGELLLKTGV
jgi:hypothetical protein